MDGATTRTAVAAALLGKSSTAITHYFLIEVARAVCTNRPANTAVRQASKKVDILPFNQVGKVFLLLLRPSSIYKCGYCGSDHN